MVDREDVKRRTTRVTDVRGYCGIVFDARHKGEGGFTWSCLRAHGSDGYYLTFEEARDELVFHVIEECSSDG